MHHFPVSKGDSLCPLGFHPQVRWPTRCKRCFRDYKEHCGKKQEESLRKDTVTASTPSLSQSFDLKKRPRSWASSDNLQEGNLQTELNEYKSTLDLSNLDNSSTYTTVNLRLPKRRSVSLDESTDKERAKNENTNGTNSINDDTTNRVQIKEVKTISNGPTNNDVQFVIQVKKKPTRSPSTEVYENNIDTNNKSVEDKEKKELEKKLQETLAELEESKLKCKKLEKEKRDVILRRLPALDSTNKISSSETHKLQQKYNDLQKELKDVKEEKSSLQIKIKILEDEIKTVPKEKASLSVEDLKSKLKAAETLCEELMEENESLKKDVHEMEEQLDEMHDNFREDQVAEYSSLKAELEQTTKNCRILSFKLRKAEKKNEQYETERRDYEKKIQEISENHSTTGNLEKIKRLEKELADSTNVSSKLQTELGELNKKILELEGSKKIGSKTTEKKKISRTSLIRSGSQDEPETPKEFPEVSEIERDLREQLKYAEEEATNLRKIISRMENDNEVMLLQLKKMANAVKSKHGTLKNIDVDEELKLQLELTEQEASPGIKPLLKSSKTSDVDTNKKIEEYEQQIKTFKTKIDEEKLLTKQKQTELTKLTKKWENETKKLKTIVDSLQEKNKTLLESIQSKDETLQTLEKKLSNEKANIKITQNLEIEKLKTEISSKNDLYSKLQANLKSIQTSESELKNKLKELESQKQSLQTEFTQKSAQLEADLKNEKKKSDLLKKELDSKTTELKGVKSQISKKDVNLENKLQIKIKELEENKSKLSAELQENESKLKDITAKYEELENEYSTLVTKLTTEKDSLNSELQTIKQRYNNLVSEKKEFQEKYDRERAKWIAEKASLQRKVRESSGNGSESNDLDKMRFNSLIGEKQSELDKYKKENESLTYQIDYMKKESDELKKKLDDYTRVNKIQRNMSADSTAMEKEIRDLKNRLSNVERTKKADILKCKMNYEEQLATVSNEMKMLQGQIIRFKKEKDTYKNMLQSAQKSIGDLKIKGIGGKASMALEVELSKLSNLEAQVSALEDELSETRLECSKFKTQMVSDKSTYEVKILEMQTRINELEEEKILNSGRTKIAGVRTCLELSWQKEREEQQRVLQETATLARDLRQTLFEVEKERDKERLETKRKFDQFKKTTEEEQMESKRKVKDLQCDLLELRDAHAKLRTTNERLRRERDKIRKDEELLRHKTLNRNTTDDAKNLGVVLRHIETLKCLATEVQDVEKPNKLGIVKATTDDEKEKLENVVSSLLNISQDLCVRIKDVDSLEKEVPVRPSRRPLDENDRHSKFNNKASLKRRSLSLEHTNPQKEQNIWQTENRSITSLRSAGSDLDMWASDNLDSRLSDSSVQSDIGADKKKKKKGIIGKIKKMTKSKSIDEGDSGFMSHLWKKPSSMENVTGSATDLKDKITGIFKRGGSSSRSNSVERQKPQDIRRDTSSRQRPLMQSPSPAKEVLKK